MSGLSEFLHPAAAEEREVVVSRRFVRRGGDGKPILDEAGKPVPKPFRIRAVTQEEADAIMRSATRTRRDRTGRAEREFDAAAYSRGLVAAGTVEPDFRDAELCAAYGVADPALVPGKMLYAGEYQRLADAIAELSGIGEDLEEAAKN